MAVLLGASMVLGSVGGAGTSVGSAGTGSLARAVTEEGNFEEETTLNSGSELEEEVSEENNADAENDADAENHTDGENNSDEEDGKKYPYEFVIAIDAGHQGQGNFETLCGTGLNTFYMFLCKCDTFMDRFDMARFSGVLVNEKDLRFLSS